MVRGECSTGRLRRTLSGCAEEPRTRRVCGFGKRRREPASEAARYVVRERPVGGLAHDAAQPNLAGEALLPAASVAQHGEPPVFNGSAPRGSERENSRPHTLVVKFQLVCERDAAGRCCQTSRCCICQTARLQGTGPPRFFSSTGGDAQESGGGAQDSANHRVGNPRDQRGSQARGKSCAPVRHSERPPPPPASQRCEATCSSTPPRARWSDITPCLSESLRGGDDLGSGSHVDDHSCPGPRAASSSGGGDQRHAEVCCCSYVQLGSAGDC